jgi:hypothetical protein
MASQKISIFFFETAGLECVRANALSGVQEIERLLPENTILKTILKKDP